MKLLSFLIILLFIPIVMATEDAPLYHDPSTNSTLAGTDIMHSLRWTDEVGLSGYIFSFDNGTGTLVNDSWTSFNGVESWSNVTKNVNSTANTAIRWCVHANNTAGLWNSTSCESPFTYLTTSYYSFRFNESLSFNTQIMYVRTVPRSAGTNISINETSNRLANYTKGVTEPLNLRTPYDEVEEEIPVYTGGGVTITQTEPEEPVTIISKPDDVKDNWFLDLGWRLLPNNPMLGGFIMMGFVFMLILSFKSVRETLRRWYQSLKS